jgi:hypothetical protein
MLIGLSSQWQWASDALELRRLRHRLPNAHRAWSLASGKHRPETDAEYLIRLCDLARERMQAREGEKHSGAPRGDPVR